MCKMMTTGLIGLAPRRKRAGYTQQAFADALDIERTRLAMWEIGKAWPSAAWLPKMADLLCCDIDALYERPEDEAEEDLSTPLRVAQDDKGIIPGRED